MPGWSPFYYYLGGDPLSRGLDWGHAALLAGVFVALVAAATVAFGLPGPAADGVRGTAWSGSGRLRLRSRWTRSRPPCWTPTCSPPGWARTSSTGWPPRRPRRRLVAVGSQRAPHRAPGPAWRRFLGQFRDPLIYLLFAAVVVSLVAWVAGGRRGRPFDAIVIAAIVVANAVLGYVQEARAEQAVAALQRMAAATAGGRARRARAAVPRAEVVPGDILLLAEGDAVAADGRLVEAASLTVAEASLTGESEAVLKDVAPIAEPAALGDRVNMVFSGTAVARGRGPGRRDGDRRWRRRWATSPACSAGRRRRATPLQREIDRIGRMLGIAVIAIAVVVVAAILLTADIQTARTSSRCCSSGVSLAVAAVPEGLPAVLSVVLALGVQRMARQRAIVKKLSSVETLGSASVICSDKTGTLTKNEMTIEQVVTGSGEVDVTGSGYRPEGELRVDGRPLDDPVLLDEVRAVLGGGSLANDAVLREDGRRVDDPGRSDRGRVPGRRGEGRGLPRPRRARFERVGEVPFTSERKLMSTLHADARARAAASPSSPRAPPTSCWRAAPRSGSATGAAASTRRGGSEILADVERLADLALRTLAVAYRPLPDGERRRTDESVERELVYLGLVGIIDPPRAGGTAAIAEAHAAGVRVLMITGDHPHTAARIAADLGIAAPAPVPSRAASSTRSTTTRSRDAVREVSVYARVAPEHKLRIVDALQADGRIVAMTGDGVNDAPALKAADIGVAMGVAGTDVAKEAADMILADDNFATIVGAVREGRGDLREHPQVPALPALVEHRRGLHDVLRRRARRRARARRHGRGDRGAAARDADPLDQPAHRQRARARARRGPASRRRHAAPAAPVTDRVIDARMWVGIFWVGAVMAAVTLLALDLFLPGGVVAGAASLTRRGRWRSRPWCSPSSSTASTRARSAPAPSTGCSRTAGCGARSRCPCSSRSRSCSCR